MKRSFCLILIALLIITTLLATCALRMASGASSLNPMTSDIPWTPIAIAGGVALVAVIVLLVLGKVGKK